MHFFRLYLYLHCSLSFIALNAVVALNVMSLSYKNFNFYNPPTDHDCIQTINDSLDWDYLICKYLTNFNHHHVRHRITELSRTHLEHLDFQKEECLHFVTSNLLDYFFVECDHKPKCGPFKKFLVDSHWYKNLYLCVPHSEVPYRTIFQINQKYTYNKNVVIEIEYNDTKYRLKDEIDVYDLKDIRMICDNNFKCSLSTKYCTNFMVTKNSTSLPSNIELVVDDKTDEVTIKIPRHQPFCKNNIIIDRSNFSEYIPIITESRLLHGIIKNPSNSIIPLNRTHYINCNITELVTNPESCYAIRELHLSNDDYDTVILHIPSILSTYSPIHLGKELVIFILDQLSKLILSIFDEIITYINQFTFMQDIYTLLFFMLVFCLLGYELLPSLYISVVLITIKVTLEFFANRDEHPDYLSDDLIR
nr:hypothetical protein 2 [Turkana negevirus]